jgi:hypothetical protein
MNSSKYLSFDSAVDLIPSELVDDLEKHTVKKANEVASTEVRKRLDWFSEAEETLIDLTEKRNLAFKEYVKQPSEENHQRLTEMRC